MSRGLIGLTSFYLCSYSLILYPFFSPFVLVLAVPGIVQFFSMKLDFLFNSDN
jgi:hypothetical protein